MPFVEDPSKKVFNLFMKSLNFFTNAIMNFQYAGKAIGRKIFVIELVGRIGPCMLKDITELLRLPTSTAGRWIDELVQEELLLRTSVKNDRRAVKLSLSDSGRAVYTSFVKSHANVFSLLQDEFSKDEWVVIVKFLQVLSDSDPE